ncbi:MAG: DUF6494 family protein [Gemmatimonadales bacterium]
MSDDAANLSIRRFLKEFGVTAQQEIEKALQTARDNGRISGSVTVRARAKLDIPDLNTYLEIEGDIKSEG